jgi:Protein of unknown function (DUF1670)
MGMRPTKRWQAYDASDRKTFHSALCRLLHTEFPGVFGPLITKLFADKIGELYDRFHPPGSRFKAGQVLWTAVAVDDPPSHNKRIEDTRLLPIILDLVNAQDISDAVAKKGWAPIRRNKIVRLCRQAYAQKAVLSLADVSLLMGLNLNTVSQNILAYERETGESVPRRGTIHDMGPSVTHKAIICYKRFVERKTTSQVAQETFHSVDEVEYYVQCFRQVQLCHDKGMSKEDIARVTAYSLPLVQQYLDLIKRFGLPFPMLPTTSGKDGE